MYKEVFNELVKLAREKKAFGYNPYGGMGMYGIGGRGRRGGGLGAPTMMIGGRGGFYAGMDPRFAGLAGQNMYEMSPHQQFQRGIATEGGLSRQELDDRSYARERIPAYEEKTEQAGDRMLALKTRVGEAAAKANAAQDAMNKSMWGRLAYGGWNPFGSSTHDEFLRAKAEYESAQAAHAAGHQLYSSRLQNYQGKEKQWGDTEAAIRGSGADVRSKVLGSQLGQGGQRPPMGGAPVKPVTGVKPTAVPPAHTTPLPSAPATPKMSMAAAAPYSLDVLAEGAARSMMERYIKIANAKLAVELKTRQYMVRPKRPIEKPKPTSFENKAPTVLTTEKYLDKPKPGILGQSRGSIG